MSPESDSFLLHERLAMDCEEVLDWPLCRVLLARDANYPWLILVPRRLGLRDFHNLAGDDLAQASREIVWASETLETLFQADKLNVAALGNQVPQLHIHVIARFHDDEAWPGPIWGVAPALAYEPDLLASRLAALKDALRAAAAGSS